MSEVTGGRCVGAVNLLALLNLQSVQASCGRVLGNTGSIVSLQRKRGKGDGEAC